MIDPNQPPSLDLLLESQDLFVDEAALTGETFPVEKRAGALPADTTLARRANVLFTGTHVLSGSARAVVVHTGVATAFGRLESAVDVAREAADIVLRLLPLILLATVLASLLPAYPAAAQIPAPPAAGSWLLSGPTHSPQGACVARCDAVSPPGRLYRPGAGNDPSAVAGSGPGPGVYLTQ